MPDSGLHVLVVDDDEVDRARVVRALDGRHTVREASTAEEARAGAEIDTDVVLLDVRLPDADGTDLLPWFETLGLPVVMLSGVEDTSVVVEAMQRGAQDYLVKGRMDGAVLERALRRAVETSQLRRELADHQRQLAEQAAALEIKNREVRELASALTLAEQAERRRVAGLLHDHLQQYLFGAQLMVQSLPAPDEAAQARVTRVHDAIGQCIAVARQLTLDLTPPVLDHEDFSVALRWLASYVEETYELAVEVEAEGEVVVESREVRVLLVELVRELLFNVVKHADVDRARVRLTAAGDGLAVTVEDAGRGFDPATLTPGGFGLVSIRGRLELIGGALDVRSVPGEGTRVTFTLAHAAAPSAS